MLSYLMASLALLVQAASPIPLASEDDVRCNVSASQLQQNTALPWSDFEFQPNGSQPMGLAGRGCFSAAARAGLDYLAHGPLLDTRQHAITTFHVGRNLAFAGREKEAAVAVAAARRADQQPTGLDWNSYVRGVYSFLVRDRTGLRDSIAALSARTTEGDRTNTANLQRLERCFARTYYEAMSDPACAD